MSRGGRKRSCRSLGLVAAAIPAVCQAETAPFDPQARVTEALAKVKAKAMNRDRLDWAAIEARARLEAAKARDEVDMLPAYHALVYRLDDNQHSFIIPPPERREAFNQRYSGRRYLPDAPPFRRPTSTFVKRNEVSSTDYPAATTRIIRQVVVPAFDGDDGDRRFATSIYKRLVAPGSVCGVIVDLRGNTGGNMFPMLAGLSPLFGSDHRVAIDDDNGKPAEGRLRHGAFYAREAAAKEATVLASVEDWRAVPALARASVAVLTDDGTTSSGEGVTIAFKHRPATRSFGATTFGKASNNAILALSDGTQLAVTVSYMRDATGRVYPAGIAPDVAVAASVGAGDAPLEAARKWLAERPACSVKRPSR